MANSTSSPVQTIHVVDWTSRVLATIAIAISCFQLYQAASKPVTPPDNPPVVVTPPQPDPTPGTAQLGHDYAVHGIVGTWAQSMEAASVAIASGSSAVDAAKAYETGWEAARKQAWASTVIPALQAISPGGKELDSVTRPKVAKLFHDLATGGKTVK